MTEAGSFGCPTIRTTETRCIGILIQPTSHASAFVVNDNLVHRFSCSPAISWAGFPVDPLSRFISLIAWALISGALLQVFVAQL